MTEVLSFIIGVIMGYEARFIIQRLAVRLHQKIDHWVGHDSQ